MEDIEFRQKLRETLEDFDKRLRMLEHTCNDVIIGSLESAANEYADNEAYETFKGNYGAEIEPMVVPYKALFGEDYDIERALYDDIKKAEGYGSEGFDEAGIMKARIEDLKARLDAVRAEEKEIKEEIKEEENKEEESSETVDNTKEEDEVSEEQLAEELKEALKEGI
jgi:hypothetical protein